MDRYARATLRCWSEDIDVHLVIKIKGDKFTIVGSPFNVKRAADEMVALKNEGREERQAAK